MGGKGISGGAELPPAAIVKAASNALAGRIEEAVVEDEGQTHSGPAAIKAWKTAASAKYAYTSAPFAVEQKDGQYIVTSRLTGNFPGSPVDLRYRFRLERGKIADLVIAP